MGAHDQRIASDQAAWAAAIRLGEFSYAGLSAAVSIPLDRATRLVRGWVRSGAVEALGKQGGRTLRFRCRPEATPGPTPPTPPSGEGNMWRTMRAMRAAFTPTDIAAHATTGDVLVSRDEAQLYCQLLARAGYLRVARKAAPPRREAVYRLVRDTGPQPPRERRVRAVWDANLAEFTHLSGAGQ